MKWIDIFFQHSEKKSQLFYRYWLKKMHGCKLRGPECFKIWRAVKFSQLVYIKTNKKKKMAQIRFAKFAEKNTPTWSCPWRQHSADFFFFIRRIFFLIRRIFLPSPERHSILRVCGNKFRAGHFRYFLAFSIIKNYIFALFIKLITYFCTSLI